MYFFIILTYLYFTVSFSLKIRKVNAFKRRCNSFFMDLVSQLCFSDDLPPSRVVVEKLMSYITVTARRGIGGRTTSKEMSVFEEGIDPTPVLRSFLLQHLLRTRLVILPKIPPLIPVQ